jgi:rRNA maturation RNase YbeY
MPTSATGAAPREPAPELDLAFRLETTDGDPLPASLAGLLQQAGPLADASRAEGHWQELLALWLAALAAELPAELRSAAYSLGLMLTDDASIAALNSTWRQRNEPTDVLSFAALESGLEDGPPLPLPPGLFEATGLGEEFAEEEAEDEDEEDEEDEEEGEDEEDEEYGEDGVMGEGLDAEPRVAFGASLAFEPSLALEPSSDLEPSSEPLELGDIVISLETAARQAAAADTSLEAELLFLASHGLLHLLGWDHPDADSLAAMLSRQEALIAGARAGWGQ